MKLNNISINNIDLQDIENLVKDKNLKVKL